MPSPERYRKKQVEVEAVQWTGENREEVEAFAGGSVLLRDGAALHHLEAIRGDWIVRSDEGVPRVVPAERFQATYEPVEEGELGSWLRAKIAHLKAVAEDSGTHPDERLRAEHWAAAYTTIVQRVDPTPDPQEEEVADA
jgi:hypothetical protein